MTDGHQKKLPVLFSGPHALRKARKAVAKKMKQKTYSSLDDGVGVKDGVVTYINSPPPSHPSQMLL